MGRVVRGMGAVGLGDSSAMAVVRDHPIDFYGQISM